MTHASPMSPIRILRLKDRVGVSLAFATYLGGLGLAWWIAQDRLPSQIGLSLFGHWVGTHSLHDHINNAALIFALLPAVLWIESAAVGWEASSIRQLLVERPASVRTDLACFFLGQAHVLDLVGRVLVLGGSMISGVWVRDWLQARFGLVVDPSGLPFVVQLLAYFYLATFFDYWTHRIDHSRIFWPLHRFHHSAREFAVVTSVRQHPAAFTPIIVVNLPMAILGAPPEVMIYVNVLVVGIGFLIHSKIDSDWGWFGRYVIQSPVHHRLHHKLDMSTPTGHFGMAPIWDRLFGTWYGTADQSLPIGVTARYAHGYFIPRDMVRDYLDFWRGVLGRPNDVPEHPPGA